MNISEIAGTRLTALILFFIIIFITFVIRTAILYILDKKIGKIVKKTSTEVDDLLLRAVRTPLGYIILLHGFYLAVFSLDLPERVGDVDILKLMRNIYILIFSFIMLYFAFKLVDVVGVLVQRRVKKTESTIDDQLAPFIVKSLRILVVTIGVLFILQNFGYNITSLLAGFGLGGLALALAAQDTVSNLLGSFTIFSDKPFKLGDWIRIGDFEGTVEDIGFRSTRIRRFDQAQVTIPNSQFTRSGVINYSAMRKRRIKFDLGITYGTSSEKIRAVVDGIKNIIKEDDRFDHSFYMVYFTEFGAYSLNIFIYCFTKTTVWDEYLKVREDFNLKIMQLLESLGVEIAFPSQTIYLERNHNADI